MANPIQIQAQIAAALPDAKVQVLDPMNDGQHLQAVVISPSFNGQNLVQRHRAVYAALGNAFAGELHALQLKTLTPEEAANV